MEKWNLKCLNVDDISPSSLALGEMQDQQQAATLDQPAKFKLI